MFDGSVKPVESLAVGDEVMGPDSTRRVIIALHSGTAEMYEIAALRGAAPFIVDENHLLHLEKTTEGRDKRPGRHGVFKNSGPAVVDISVKNYLSKSKNFKNCYKLLRSSGIDFHSYSGIDYRIDPYTLGLYLGDGSSYERSVSITTMDAEIRDAIYAYADSIGMLVRPDKKRDGNRSINYHLRGCMKGNRYWRNQFRESLDELNLGGKDSGTKFIPVMYKCGDRVSRLNVLAGLLDTDGSLEKNCFDLTLKSKRLLLDAIFVARSLGLMCAPAYEKVVDGTVYWRTVISGHTDIIPTRLPHKQAGARRQKKSPHRSGFSVNPMGPGEFYGFTVDSDNLYLTADFVIHHNCGKTISYLTAALVKGGRTAIVTATKPLQDQISEDFSSIGVFDMRGLQNYTCVALAEGGELEKMWTKRWGKPTCDVGPCTSGIRCDLKQGGCTYFDANRAANAAEVVLTNYAYWIAIHKYGQGLGKFDRLILDECHSADSSLASAMSVELNDKDFRELGSQPPKASAPIQNWRMWARVQLNKVQGKLEFFAQGARVGQTVGADGTLVLVRDTDLPDASEMRFWKRLEGKCATLSEASDDWVVETDERKTIRISPIWVRKYAEECLFLNIPRVIMMSATVRPKIKDLLDITGTCLFKEYPSTFPVWRRPIYWIPTVRLNNASPQEDLKTWVVRIDQIIARRLDRKGIIHTVSFQRQQYLLAHSRFRHLMHANMPGNTRDVVKGFRDADAPALLVSPSVGTGFDFPFDLCRYQIIGKVPFRDPRGAIISAQSKEDPNYLNYLTSQDLVQLYGRSNRDPLDFSETFLTDDHIEWFLDKYSGYRYDKVAGRFLMNSPKPSKPESQFFPYYFLEAFQRVDSVMDPPALEDVT